jgi:hypothetical protein
VRRKKSYIENIFSERKKEGDDRVRLERERVLIITWLCMMRLTCASCVLANKTNSSFFQSGERELALLVCLVGDGGILV